MTTSVVLALASDIWEKSKTLITKDSPNWATQSYCSLWQWVRMSSGMSLKDEVTKEMATV